LAGRQLLTKKGAQIVQNYNESVFRLPEIVDTLEISAW